MQWAKYSEFLGLFLKAMKHEPKERIFSVPVAVRVVGSKLTGYAMDKSSQMPAELNVSF
jgi:hypothetical protein